MGISWFRPVALTLISAFTVACASSTAVIKSEFDEQAAFDTYRTFAIADEAGEMNMIATDGYDVAVMNAELAPDLQQIAWSVIVEELEKKGLSLAESVGEADLVVTYLVNVGAKPEVLAPDYRVDSWSSQAELGQRPVATGTLIVDILDPDLKEGGRSFLVWRGWAQDTIDPENPPEERGGNLRRGLKRILDRYPR